MMTNFHMPRTTVLALVMAFAGRDRFSTHTAKRFAIATAFSATATRC